MTDLERRLGALADELAWPPPRDLVPGVLARIAGERAPAEARDGAGAPGGRRARRRLASRPLPALAALLAVVVVAVAALLAASPGVRADLRRLLGLGTVRVEIVRELPPLRAGSRADLGARVTAAEAVLNTGRAAPSARALGPPDALYLGGEPPGTLTAAYRPRPGLPEAFDGIAALVSTFPGDPFAFVGKLVAGGTPLRRVRVAGAPGLWIPGPHGIVVGGRGNAPAELPPRLAGPTLLWVRGGLTYRLEARVPLARALRIAASVR